MMHLTHSQEVQAMKLYGPKAIRNVAVVGHGASGKTSLVEALAHVSGSSRRHGRVAGFEIWRGGK